VSPHLPSGVRTCLLTPAPASWHPHLPPGTRICLLAPSPSPRPPSSPALRERKGEGVPAPASWRSHLPPDARTCLLAPAPAFWHLHLPPGVRTCLLAFAPASWPPHLPPGPLPSRAAGEEGGRRKGGWNMARESMLAPLTQWLHRDETCPMRRLGFLIRFSGRVRDNAWLFVCHCDGMGLSCGLV
jgi:hypothetical protein